MAVSNTILAALVLAVLAVHLAHADYPAGAAVPNAVAPAVSPVAPVKPAPVAPVVPAPLAPPVVSPVAPAGPYLDLAGCNGACGYRCSKSKRPNLCQRSCGACCRICKCVPSGTYGNHQECPCYAKLTTHGGRPKCP